MNTNVRNIRRQRIQIIIKQIFLEDRFCSQDTELDTEGRKILRESLENLSEKVSWQETAQ